MDVQGYLVLGVDEDMEGLTALAAPNELTDAIDAANSMIGGRIVTTFVVPVVYAQTSIGE